MALSVSSRLGHYDVTALIGEGGMGQVYQATDTKLNREVALKVLPEAFATDPDRLARFQREAQVLASLNHPNIAQIHGLEEVDGIRALVLELVEGPTLADRIKQGPIPLDEALPIAKQIAEALEAAHEAGVIHRDLKPANVKVKDDGTVKVLDFGLAKALDPNPGGDPSQSPTLTAAATQMGVIMGTAAYMSPEQAGGQTADKRSDIWSFGVVLFEMLTGQQLFTGKTVSHVLARVLERELDFSVLPATTPAPIKRLLRRCLEREPKRRLSNVGEALIHFEEAVSTPTEEPSAATAIASSGWRQALPLALAMSAVAALITGVAVWSVIREAPSPTIRFTEQLADRGRNVELGTGLALSEDGTKLAYAAVGDEGQRIYVRSLDQLEAQPIRGTEGGQDVFWSPHGEWLGFQSDGSFKKVSLSGGAPVTLSPAPSVPLGASWGQNDSIVFGTGPGRGLSQVSAQGGTPEPFTTLDADASEAAHYSPDILPDGDVLFTVLEGSGVNRIAIKLSDESNHRILLDGRHPRYVPTGHLVFMRTGSLWAVPFDVDALALSGTPAPVLEGVSSGAGMGQFALALDGSLAYVPGGNTTVPTLVWVDREGREEPVPAEPRDYSGLRISPDGRRVAISSSDSGPPDVEVYDLVRNTPTRLTFAPEGDSYPTWSRDGAHVAFASARDGVLNPYWKAADGTGEVERLATYDGALAVHSWSGDGSVAVVSGLRQETGLNIGLLSMDGTGAIEWVLDEEYDESYPDVSPDGRWMAYISNESGQFEVYVRPFPNVDDGRYQISRDGGLSPVWGPDGRELFFLSALSSAGQTTVMTVAVDTDPTFAAGIPSPLFEGPYRTLVPPSQEPWDISPDGERFLMMKEVQRAAGTGRVIVVHNWVEELTRLVPVP